MAPGVIGPGTSAYIAAHNQLRAHAAAYRAYYQDFATQGGKVGISLNINWAEPRDETNEDDVAASDTVLNFSFGWYAHPIFIDGKYPPVMRSKIDAKSSAQGFNESRLPQFTDKESSMILGSSDFLGINFYTANVVYPEMSNISDIGFYADQDIGSYQDESWFGSGSSWLKVTPWGIRRALNWVSEKFSNPDIYITENGFSDKLGNLDDLQRLVLHHCYFHVLFSLNRIYYYKHYINQVLKTVGDGVRVKGYYAWSLMDNFEWAQGYTEKFGLHSVNMTDPERRRTPKESALFYSSLVKQNGFVKAENNCSK